jgi:hypothetical protein
MSMEAQVEIFYGSLATSAGGMFKSMQIVKVLSLDEMKQELNAFLSRPEIEVLSLNHQFNDGIMSVLVYFRKK